MRHFEKIDWSVSLTVLFACVLTVVTACVESSGPLGGPNVIEGGTVSSVQITLAQSTLSPGQATQATVVAKSADGKLVSGHVDYSSQNPSIATVTSQGIVTARAAGSATIQGTVSGMAGSASLTVNTSGLDTLAPLFAFHDFNDGTLGPYVDVFGADVDFIDDPTGSGRGKVARLFYSSTDAARSPGASFSTPVTAPWVLRYGRTLWMRGDFYLPSTGLTAHQQDDNRKLIDYHGLGSTRMTLHRVLAGTKRELRMSIVDYMSGSVQEVMDPDTGIEILSDTWYTIEVKIVTNSADNVRDGVVEIYMNGAATPTFQRTTGIGWITEAFPGGSDLHWWEIGTQLSVLQPDPNYSEYRYWDNVAFSTTRIER